MQLKDKLQQASKIFEKRKITKPRQDRNSQVVHLSSRLKISIEFFLVLCHKLVVHPLVDKFFTLITFLLVNLRILACELRYGSITLT